MIALARDSFQLKIVGFFPNVSTAKFGGHTYLYVSDEPPKIEYYVTELVRKKEMPQILLRLNLALLNASEYGEFEVTIYNGQNLTLLIQDYKKIGNEIIDKFNRDIASSWENNIFLNVDLAKVKDRILEAWFQK